MLISSPLSSGYYSMGMDARSNRRLWSSLSKHGTRLPRFMDNPQPGCLVDSMVVRSPANNDYNNSQGFENEVLIFLNHFSSSSERNSWSAIRHQSAGPHRYSKTEATRQLCPKLSLTLFVLACCSSAILHCPAEQKTHIFTFGTLKAKAGRYFLYSARHWSLLILV